MGPAEASLQSDKHTFAAIPVVRRTWNARRYEVGMSDREPLVPVLIGTRHVPNGG